MTEQQLRELIELKYGSVRQMALKIFVKNTVSR